MRHFGDENRAQSEIIGAILLIAITLVLASLVAVYVFDVGQQTTGDAAPQVSFSFESNAGELRATHEGGQTVNANRIEIVVTDIDDGTNNPAFPTGAGSGTDDGTTRGDGTDAFGSEIEVGDSAVVAENVHEDDIVRIVYVNPDTEQGTTLGRYVG